MATSPSHQFGQIIGDALEASIAPLLEHFATEHNLYLDRKGQRSCREGKRVSWVDSFGNRHDLDFVLERNGTPDHIGTPVAFIETAWRRYTKHSRNKAQEIQGAILPLATTHSHAVPFIGVILAGVFTDGALTQLRSQGFNVLYVPYETVLKAFASAGVDAAFDEDTPDDDFALKVKSWKALNEKQRHGVFDAIIQMEVEQVKQFFASLHAAVTRFVQFVRVLPLHGSPADYKTIEQAIDFLQNHSSTAAHVPFVKYEIEIRYSNGDRIQATFAERQAAITFLATYSTPPLKPIVD